MSTNYSEPTCQTIIMSHVLAWVTETWHSTRRILLQILRRP